MTSASADVTSASTGHVEQTWPGLTTLLIERQDLTLAQARWAMEQVMTGAASPVQLAGFLVALRAKGESVAEIRGLADVMLEHAHQITVPGETIDIVGTGGDRFNTVNISTMSSVVLAGAGLTVVKHGNRAASSRSGSADVLEELGVALTLTPEQVASLAEEVGITFCFAQAFHPSMRHAAQARSGLAVATAFNALGPLTNPAQPRYAAIGVANGAMAPLIAGVFAERGKDAVVFRGDDGLDELTLSTTSCLWWVRDGSVTRMTISPEDVGLPRSPISAIRGADAAYNAEVARRLFAGERSPVRDAVVLNAGAALALSAGAGSHAAADVVGDVVTAVRVGMERVTEVIDSGTAADLLARWVAASTRHAAS